MIQAIFPAIPNRIHGTNNADTIHGTDQVDNIYAHGGIRGDAGNDVIFGFNGNDRAYGGAGHDSIFGSNGDDEVRGESGHDRLSGGFGNDIVRGGDGNDVISGNHGRDNLWGGDGSDTFAYLSVADSNLVDGRDIIRDFDMVEDDVQVGDDVINLAPIDANTQVVADQAFAFSTNGPQANALWVEYGGSTSTFDFYYVRADNDGDAVADLDISVDVAKGDTLDIDDFIL